MTSKQLKFIFMFAGCYVVAKILTILILVGALN